MCVQAILLFNSQIFNLPWQNIWNIELPVFEVVYWKEYELLHIMKFYVAWIVLEKLWMENYVYIALNSMEEEELIYVKIFHPDPSLYSTSYLTGKCAFQYVWKVS